MPRDSQEHTPEPWEVGGDPIDGLWIIGPDISQNVIADIVTRRGDGTGRCTDEDAENAYRIVACVNACAGIPTEALEAGNGRDLTGCVRALLYAADLHADRDPGLRAQMAAVREAFGLTDSEEAANA